MHGNVWEWCQDTWHDTYKGAPTDGSAWSDKKDNDSPRVRRGGSWNDLPVCCRSAYRNWNDPRVKFYFNGFRVVCAVPRLS